MSIKKEDRPESEQRKRTSQKISTVSAGLIAAMFVMSIGMAIPSIITQQQQSAYAHPDSFDPGAEIYRISTQQQDEDEDDQNGGESDQQNEASAGEEQSGTF